MSVAATLLCQRESLLRSAVSTIVSWTALPVKGDEPAACEVVLDDTVLFPEGM
jgi:hypothetical protein